ncbi:MAG: HAD family hydrolase [Acidobacteria bacterium]|nr:HAD family hydrolase [Acidobacteriota bacterium]
MPVEIELIGLDADDTLWHNMPIFVSAEARFREMLSHYHDDEWIDQRLNETQLKNLEHFGYGIKGFTLSMIETAIDLSEGRVTGNEIRQLIELSRAMLSAPVELLDGVEETVETLAGQYRLILITKGDLFDQEGKLARSRLGSHFEQVHIVSAKTSDTYASILRSHGVTPEQFVMVGDSLRSDIVPVIEIGANAVHIPVENQWSHEIVPLEEIVDRSRFIELPTIRQRPSGSHVSDWQSRSSTQASPGPHAGQRGPPQSTSVSATTTLSTPSVHGSGRHVPASQ